MKDIFISLQYRNMKKEIKLKKTKIIFTIRKTTLKEKLEFLLSILIILAIIYFFICYKCLEKIDNGDRLGIYFLELK